MVQWDNICEVSLTEPGPCQSLVQHEWLSIFLLCGGIKVGTKDEAACSSLDGKYSLMHTAQIASAQDDCYIMVIIISCSSRF